MKKAEAGEPVKVGFLGGSITQGSLSSTPETCYAYLVYKWWKEKFPQAQINILMQELEEQPPSLVIQGRAAFITEKA